MKPLSEQLAGLSVSVKNAEDAVAAAQKEAHDKVVARVAQAQAAAEQAVQKVNQNIKSARKPELHPAVEWCPSRDDG
jgi:t-SNARE complex subunit (syntaxin)